MSTVTIENAPKSFEKQFGTRIDFKELMGISWDGMDWCQYDEVIPSQDDIRAYELSQDESALSIDWKDFLESLIESKNV